jgi:peroxiredoxin
MALIAPGTPAPDFRLIDEEGEKFTRESLLGQTTVLVFYPFAFSPVCTDQFQVYEEVLDDFAEQGAKLYGVSCDATWSQKAFREQLGVTIPQLSDFEPKGEVQGVRRVLRQGRLLQPRARDRRPRRRRAVEPRGREPRRAAGREPHLRRAGRQSVG